MKKILYCRDTHSVKKLSPVRKLLKKKSSLPLPLIFTSRTKDIYKDDFSIIIFEEKFLKRRRNLDSSRLSHKVCFMHFSKNGKNNVKIIRKLGFFDYLADEENRDSIIFKLKRAKETANLSERIKTLEEKLLRKDKKIDKVILVDPLTGCYNWRYFLHRAHQELSRARRHLYNISFIAIDIDYFRQINELYTPKAADAVIKNIVDIMRINLRKEDVITRWREDEFFIILPYMSGEDSYGVAKRIKEKISYHKFKYKNLKLSVKVSMGVVSFPEDKILNTNGIISAFDNCLSTAKRRGGDTVVRHSSHKPQTAYYSKKKEASVDDLRRKIERLNGLLSRDLFEMIYGFARAIEAKDHYTGTHVEYTASIAERIAKKLRLSKQEIENVKRAAVLHDLGKVGIEESILTKRGPLSKAEKKTIKSHSWIAAEILRGIHALRGAIPAILYHHERYNGKGYPLGLKGEEIPLNARIVAIADVYQALISDRPYRGAYSKKEAIKIVKNEAGKYFDPKIVKAFLNIIRKKL